VDSFIRSLVAKTGFGYYKPSISKSGRKKLAKVGGPGLHVENETNYEFKNLIFVSEFESLLKKCTINGGYKKFYKFWLWVNHNFKYFPMDGARTANYGGLPNFVSDASLVRIDNVKIYPNKYSGNYRQKYTFHLKPQKGAQYDIEKIISFSVGGSQTFQHFMQDCLPIIAQTKGFLKANPDIFILLQEPDKNFKTRDYFFNKLQITNIVIDSCSINYLKAKSAYFWNFRPYNSQYTLPPKFYETLRSEMSSSTLPNGQRTILLFVRNEKTRNFENEFQIIETLNLVATQHHLNLIVLNTSESQIDHVVSAVKQAVLIIGVHGGSMYNAIFCSNDCTVIEIIPTSRTNSTLHYLTYSKINYIPFPCNFDFYDEQVKVPIDTLKNLISRVINSNLHNV
jgi:capsular polysaccharide biosynthesis protein